MAHSSHRNSVLIGAAWGFGAPTTGCELAPAVLCAQLGAANQVFQRPAHWEPAICPSGGRPSAFTLAHTARRLARRCAAVHQAGDLPVVIGGDHSCAIGTWRGLAAAAAERGPIGLIWFDAHLDAHTPGTSPSQAWHGMPLAVLLGHGPRMLTGRTPCLDPNFVCVIGARSFEPEEAALLLRLGVRVISMPEVERRGLAAAFGEALEIAAAAPGGFGITLDLDALDPSCCEAVGTPVPRGLDGDAVIEAITSCVARPDLLALEIAEFNPRLDSSGTSGRWVTRLLGKQSVQGPAAMPLERRFGARNYDPLPVELAFGRGAEVWDTRGRRYLDMMSAYSAVSLGHSHPRVVAALHAQARRLAVTSRAYSNDRLGHLLKRLCELTGLDRALPVNTGAEAVETALKAARKWAYQVKGVPSERAEIICCDGNFHGRTIAIVGMSAEAQYRNGFGPFPRGFKRIPFGDSAALERAIGPNTAAFLVEPIQGEAGIRIPPAGYLARCAELCREAGVLLLCDEVQTGLARTGRWFACQHEDVRPDGIILGKALGGGLVPVSAFVATEDLMRVFTPGDHGSTFGGNPLAAAVALAALDAIRDQGLVERSAEAGGYLLAALASIDSPLIAETRGLGLFVGLELQSARGDAAMVCRRLLDAGLLTKDTHGTVLRFAPPLVITRAQIDWAVDTVARVLGEIESELKHAA